MSKKNLIPTRQHANSQTQIDAKELELSSAEQSDVLDKPELQGEVPLVESKPSSINSRIVSTHRAERSPLVSKPKYTKNDVVILPNYQELQVNGNRDSQSVAFGSDLLTIAEGSNTKRRQLSKISIDQQSGTGKPEAPAFSTRQRQSMPNAIDALTKKQKPQNYISRQGQNQQLLTQSLGDGSNLSYVFDGSSHMPTRGEAVGQSPKNNPQIKGPYEGNNTGSTSVNQANLYVDNRSASNDSYKTSQYWTQNLISKNVRNYHNLYDNRSLASKNIEMQDQLRLGGSQKLWTIKRADPFLPQIHNGAFSMQQYLQQDSLMSTPGQMKRIKHHVMVDGHPQMELHQSPIHIKKPGTHHGYQSLHHNDQAMSNTEPSSKLQNMTSNSFNKRDGAYSYTTANLNAGGGHWTDMSASNNFGLEGSHMNMLKPILRRNCLHNRNNIFIQWKSFEIQIVQLEYASTAGADSNQIKSRKLLNPVYAPLQELSQLLLLPPSQIELRVVKCLKLAPNGRQFLYVPQDPQASTADNDTTFSRKPSNGSQAKGQTGPFSADSSPVRSQSNTVKTLKGCGEESFGLTRSPTDSSICLLDEKLPEEIVTSLYVQHANADFKIIIRPPSVEYTIPSKNILVMKTLTREESQELIQSGFADWQSVAIRCLTKYNKFNELLSIIDKGIDYRVHLARLEAQLYQMPKEPSAIPQTNSSPKRRNHTFSKHSQQHRAQDRERLSSPSALQVFVLEEATGQICHYASLNEFRQERFFEPKKGGLRGCFHQSNSLGQIQVKPFAVVIKGLDLDYEYRNEFSPAQWSKIIGFMQLKSMKEPHNPKQLVDKLCKHFVRALQRAEQRALPQIPFKAASVLVAKKDARSQGTGRRNSYPLMNGEERINEKVLDLAHSCISAPSKTAQKLTDLRHRGGLDLISNEDPPGDKQAIPQQTSQDSIEQQRKRFVADSKQALRSFLSLQKRSKMLQVPKKGSVPGQEEQLARYLVEIEMPVCQVVFQGQTHSKALTEEDLVQLSSTAFCRWKNYLMSKHFRLELNIGQEKPLPRIMEDKRGEDDLISETDPRDKFPITDAEKPKIEQTRAQVTNWFPV